MTSRERTMAILLLPPMLLVGGGVLAHQMWYEPLRTRTSRLAGLERDIVDKGEELAKVEARKIDMEKYRTISLPADADLARREYEEQLSKLLRDSGFDAGSYSIVPKPIDVKTSPQFANKKPIYSRLLFTIQAKGDLLSTVNFLDNFHQLALLHKIHNLSLTRPITQTERNRNNDIDANITIEAIVLDNAEQRKALLPDKVPDLPEIFATMERKYTAIAGRDIFYGPPPAVVIAKATPDPIDYAQFIKFDSFTDGDQGATVTFYDAFNNQEVSIKPRADGDGFRVEVTYLLNGRRRPLRSGKTLEIMDSKGEIQHRWMILKVSERQVLMQDEDDYYALHIGFRLSERQKLSLQEATELGLVAVKTAAVDDKDK